MARRKQPQARDANTGRFTKTRPPPPTILQGYKPYERRLSLVPSTADNVLELIKPPKVFRVDEV